MYYKYKIIITGSNANLLSSELATHLTGRFSAFNFYIKQIFLQSKRTKLVKFLISVIRVISGFKLNFLDKFFVHVEGLIIKANEDNLPGKDIILKETFRFVNSNFYSSFQGEVVNTCADSRECNTFYTVLRGYFQ